MSRTTNPGSTSCQLDVSRRLIQGNPSIVFALYTSSYTFYVVVVTCNYLFSFDDLLCLNLSSFQSPLCAPSFSICELLLLSMSLVLSLMFSFSESLSCPVLFLAISLHLLLSIDTPILYMHHFLASYCFYLSL